MPFFLITHLTALQIIVVKYQLGKETELISGAIDGETMIWRLVKDKVGNEPLIKKLFTLLVINL